MWLCSSVVAPLWSFASSTLKQEQLTSWSGSMQKHVIFSHCNFMPWRVWFKLLQTFFLFIFELDQLVFFSKACLSHPSSFSRRVVEFESALRSCSKCCGFIGIHRAVLEFSAQCNAFFCLFVLQFFLRKMQKTRRWFETGKWPPGGESPWMLTSAS